MFKHFYCGNAHITISFRQWDKFQCDKRIHCKQFAMEILACSLCSFRAISEESDCEFLIGWMISLENFCTWVNNYKRHEMMYCRIVLAICTIIWKCKLVLTPKSDIKCVNIWAEYCWYIAYFGTSVHVYIHPLWAII